MLESETHTCPRRGPRRPSAADDASPLFCDTFAPTHAPDLQIVQRDRPFKIILKI